MGPIITALHQIKDTIDVLEDCYPIITQHFNVGDTVFYIDNYGDIVAAQVTEIDDFSDNGTIPGGCIYYWIQLENCHITIWNKIHSWLSRHTPISILTKFPSLRYYVPPCFPGHAVTAGVDIFKTRDEAELKNMLNHAYYYLEQLTQAT